MKRSVLLLGTVLMTACGHPLVNCKLNIRPAEGVTLDPDAIQTNTALAQEILDSKHLVDARDFCGAFAWVPITVRPEAHWWEISPGKAVSGLTSVTGIEITRDGTAMLHELLHVWTAEHFVFSGDHAGWRTNGYYAADEEFTHSCGVVGRLRK